MDYLEKARRVIQLEIAELNRLVEPDFDALQVAFLPAADGVAHREGHEAVAYLDHRPIGEVLHVEPVG